VALDPRSDGQTSTADAILHLFEISLARGTPRSRGSACRLGSGSDLIRRAMKSIAHPLYNGRMGTLGNDLVREARKRAGLTQSELASRAGTTQSAIARLESGRPHVSLNDVIRLVRLCGLDLEVALVPHDESDMAQAERLASLTGPQRMQRHARVARQLRGLRNAGRA
jgi:transcriptional regulator with XRE-family HTH domain